MSCSGEKISREDLEVLGLRAPADLKRIRKTYKALVKTWHPDRFPPGSQAQGHAEEHLKAINAAYRRLVQAAGSKANGESHGAPSASPRTTPPAAPSTPRSDRAPCRSWPWRVSPPRWLFRRKQRARGQFQTLRNRVSMPLLFALAALLFASIAAVLWKAGSWPHLGRVVISDPLDDPAPQGTPRPYRRAGEPVHDPSHPPPRASEDAARVSVPSDAADPHRGSSERLPGVQSPFFTLGSTQEDVWRVQGRPDRMHGQTWVYGLAEVTFKDGGVWRYNNFDGTLKVEILPSSPLLGRKTPSFFSLGAGKDEVLLVQGTPTRMEQNRWYYGLSQVAFRKGVVVGFDNFFNDLKIVMKPSGSLRPGIRPDCFTIGATADEVLAVQGTPSSVQANLWSYGLSQVLFHDGRVRMVNDFSKNLKLWSTDAGTAP